MKKNLAALGITALALAACGSRRNIPGTTDDNLGKYSPPQISFEQLCEGRKGALVYDGAGCRYAAYEYQFIGMPIQDGHPVTSPYDFHLGTVDGNTKMAATLGAGTIQLWEKTGSQTIAMLPWSGSLDKGDYWITIQSPSLSQLSVKMEMCLNRAGKSFDCDVKP